MVPFCSHCNRPVAYILTFRPDTFKVRELEVTYKECVAICADCGREVYVADINDKNVVRRRTAYFRTRRGIER